MQILFFMILSSNLLFLMLLILRTPLRYFFDFQLQDTILKVCFMLLLVPFPLIINFVQVLLFYILGSSGEYYFSNKRPLVIFSQQQIILNPAAHKRIFIVGLWFWVVCIIALYRMIPYWRFLNRVMKSSQPIDDVQVLSLFRQKKELLNITASVRLFKSSMIHSSFTTGVFRPIIIISDDAGYEETELIILHELTHIKKKDILFQLICYICITLYWFNPLIYIADYLHERISELACDESVVQTLDFDKKKCYGQLILKAAKDCRSPSARYSIFFSNKLFFKERIDCIMKTNHFQTKKKAYSSVIAAFMILLSCSPALAAPAPQLMCFDEKISEKEFSLDPNTEVYISDSTFQNNVPTIVYDEQIILENGEVIPFDPSGSPDRSICSHTYVPVQLSEHERHSDGGCTVKVYNLDQCTKCSATKSRILSATTEYVTCPH